METRCEHCEAMDEALDIIVKELERIRRSNRELMRSIRLLKRAIVNDMEKEFEAEVITAHTHEFVVTGDGPSYEVKALCQADGYAEEYSED